MATIRSLESDLVYVRELLEAGADGVASARRELAGRVLTPPLHPVACTPAAIGATVGVTTRLIGKRKSASSVAMSGLVGSVLGFGAAIAWTSRTLHRARLPESCPACERYPRCALAGSTPD